MVDFGGNMRYPGIWHDESPRNLFRLTYSPYFRLILMNFTYNASSSYCCGLLFDHLVKTCYEHLAYETLAEGIILPIIFLSPSNHLNAY